MIIGICLFCKKEFRKRERIYKFCSLICSNNFNLNGLRKIVLPQRGIDLAEFLGICTGDGSVSKYQTEIALNSIADKEYVGYVTELSVKLFPGAKVSALKKNNQNVVRVKINSRIVSDFLLAEGMTPNAKVIPLWILSSSVLIYRFMRGLFDTEGSISFKRYRSKKGLCLYKQLNFRNADVNLMIFVRDNLISLGLKPTTTLKRSLYLSNHDAIDKFRDIIGFSNQKLLTRSLIKTVDQHNKFINILSA